jgi:predicted DNA-binding transcriptional regulator AlpA
VTGRRKLLVISEITDLCRVEASTAYHWAASGTGPPSFKLNGRRVWPEDAALAWIAEQESKAS